MYSNYPLVSIILPVYNAYEWLDACLDSVYQQTFKGTMELCIFNDSSTDLSLKMIEDYQQKLANRGINVVVTADGTQHSLPKGCGYAKNKAIKSSKGDYLCFLDADDVMDPERIRMQLSEAIELPKNTILGCQVTREPPGSTIRYTRWINELSPAQLYTQIYTSHGPTVVMPTWFCHRSVFEAVGGFSEGGKGVPEDYLFFLKFLQLKGNLHRIDRSLLTYRHHPNATTLSVSEATLWDIRIRELEETVLSHWNNFTIWNAGKQGRRFYRDISETSKMKVRCFCDVDKKKIDKGYYTHYKPYKPLKLKAKVPIVHFTEAEKPFIICVKLDLTGGVFEKNLSSLNLTEGVDFVHFN